MKDKDKKPQSIDEALAAARAALKATQQRLRQLQELQQRAAKEFQEQSYQETFWIGKVEALEPFASNTKEGKAEQDGKTVGPGQGAEAPSAAPASAASDAPTATEGSQGDGTVAAPAEAEKDSPSA